MDWTPSQQAILRPATLYRPTPPAAQQTQQTPFRGHLPADVVSMEHRLRNPPNKPTFRKASVSTKQNFFKTPKRDNHRDYDYASDTATEYEPSLAETVTPAATRFADPRLRLQPGQHEDTGLERLLANAFSLDDEPQEVREIKHREVQDVPGDCQSNEYTFTQWHRLPVLILLVASYFFWTMTLKPSLTIYEVQFRLVTPFVAGLASIRSLVLMLRKDSTEWSGSDIVVFAAELMASIFLAQAVRQPPIGSFLSANHGSIETFGSIFIAVMAVQELWMLSLDLHLAWKNEDSLGISTPTPASSAKPPSFGQQQPVNGEETQKSTIAPDRTSRAPPMPVSRSTRSRTKEKNTNSRNGFGGLSLGGVEQSEGLDGMGSLSLGQPRRRDRGGMW